MSLQTVLSKEQQAEFVRQWDDLTTKMGTTPIPSLQPGGPSIPYRDLRRLPPSQRTAYSPYRVELPITPNSKMSDLVRHMGTILPVDFNKLERFKGQSAILGVMHETATIDARGQPFSPDQLYKSSYGVKGPNDRGARLDSAYNITLEENKFTVTRPLEIQPGSNGSNKEHGLNYNTGALSFALNGHFMKTPEMYSAKALIANTALINYMAQQAKAAGKEFIVTGHDSLKAAPNGGLKCCPGCDYTRILGLDKNGRRDPKIPQIGDPAVLSAKAMEHSKIAPAAWAALSDADKFKHMDKYIRDEIHPEAQYAKSLGKTRDDYVAGVNAKMEKELRMKITMANPSLNQADVAAKIRTEMQTKEVQEKIDSRRRGAVSEFLVARSTATISDVRADNVGQYLTALTGRPVHVPDTIKLTEDVKLAAAQQKQRPTA